MVTGPRPTPHPIVLHVNDQGNPVRLAESSSIYVTTVSAVTISATNYLGLEVSGGVPGGDLSSLQFKTGNTTFNGSPFLKYSPQLSGLLANAVSATRVLASNLSATTISATTYLNLPGTNLSSLLDVQYASVSGGQALVYSSSINKWAPGYTIYKSDAVPVTSVGVNGDIYLQYTDDSTNAAYLSSLLDTNINAVSNGQSLIWSSGYWIASSLSTATPGAITNIPSASPIWNAASAEGYNIQFGIYSPVTQFDVLGFSVAAQQITNFAPSSAGPILGAQVNLSSLKDTGTLLGAPNNSLIARSTTEPLGGWIATLSPILNSLTAGSISATNWQGLPSATPTWNANKISNLPVNFSNLQPFDIFGINFLTTELTNFAASTAASFLVAQADLSAIRDVWATQAVEGDVLIYTDGYWEPSNSISLVNVSATTVRAVDVLGTRANITNVSATTVSSTNLSAINARITGLSATTISSTNWQGLPSATPIWNATSANGYDIEFGIYSPVTPFDIMGFSFESPERITNFAPSSAGPILGAQVNLSSLKDTGTLLGAPNNSLIARTTTEPLGNWVATLDPTLNSITAGSMFAVSADLSSVKLTRYVEPKSTVTISSSSITLNLNNAQVFEISAISNISSITIQNPSSRSNIVQGFTIIFSADGTQRTVTNWGSIKWSGGTGPTLTSTNNKKDILSFMSPDNGTNWYGFIGGQNF